MGNIVNSEIHNKVGNRANIGFLIKRTKNGKIDHAASQATEIETKVTLHTAALNDENFANSLWNVQVTYGALIVVAAIIFLVLLFKAINSGNRLRNLKTELANLKNNSANTYSTSPTSQRNETSFFMQPNQVVYGIPAQLTATASAQFAQQMP